MLDAEAGHRGAPSTGQWAVRLILLSLLVTPLRRVAQWPKLINVRRMVGVAAFAYALAHFTIYVVLDQKLDAAARRSEIVLRFYLTIGFVALLGLTRSAATSTDAMIRRLGGQRWNRLHKLIYVIAALGDLPLLPSIESRRLRAGADDGLLLHPDDLSRCCRSAGCRPGPWWPRLGARRADRHRAPRGDLVRDRCGTSISGRCSAPISTSTMFPARGLCRGGRASR